MNFKALYDRLSGALRPVWTAAATHVLLHLSLALSAFKEAVRGFARRGYPHYLAVVIGLLLLPAYLVWTLPVGLVVHFGRFLREAFDDISSALRDLTREAWERWAQNVR